MADQEDYRLSILRDKLNNEKIKLWLPPYTKENDKSLGHYPTELISKYSQELNVSAETTVSFLEMLRIHALENLSLRNKYQNTGVATLKVKIVGDVPRQTSSSSSVLIETGLHIYGKDLKDMICKKSDLNNVSLKLISKGKVILENVPLQEQNIKHNSQIMALAIPKDASKDLAESEKQHARLQKTREDAELLASSTDDFDHTSGPHLEVADQNGRVLKLPPGEQKALALAMTFHEKGRATIKKKKYAEALVFLLESDNEFRKCNAEILQFVDNYALLCLDITWCYLQLRSISHLPDAGKRLEICESGFQRSYGQNLERLEVLKSGVGKEASLLARLHLLQGVLAFYKNKKEECRNLLMKAQCEINNLKVDDEKLSQVMNMGYSATEARLALRQSGGNIEMAIVHILKQQEEKKEIQEKEQEERRIRQQQHKLGKTENGEWVNVQNYRSLIAMGFPKPLALAAIKHSNNNVSLAIQILQEHSHLLQIPDKKEYFSDEDITDEEVALIASQGFEPEDVRKALSKAKGNTDEAINMLLHGDLASPSSSSQSRNLEEQEKRIEAVKRLAADIPQVTEDHLDLTLEEEENILNEYLSLLDTLPT